MWVNKYSNISVIEADAILPICESYFIFVSRLVWVINCRRGRHKTAARYFQHFQSDLWTVSHWSRFMTKLQQLHKTVGGKSVHRFLVCGRYKYALALTIYTAVKTFSLYLYSELQENIHIQNTNKNVKIGFSRSIIFWCFGWKFYLQQRRWIGGRIWVHCRHWSSWRETWLSPNCENHSDGVSSGWNQRPF